MTPQERKAVAAMVRLASDMYAAGMGSKPIFENRDHMREQIAQSVEADMALLGAEGVLAEWLILANEGTQP